MSTVLVNAVFANQATNELLNNYVPQTGDVNANFTYTSPAGNSTLRFDAVTNPAGQSVATADVDNNSGTYAVGPAIQSGQDNITLVARVACRSISDAYCVAVISVGPIQAILQEGSGSCTIQWSNGSSNGSTAVSMTPGNGYQLGLVTHGSPGAYTFDVLFGPVGAAVSGLTAMFSGVAAASSTVIVGQQISLAQFFEYGTQVNTNAGLTIASINATTTATSGSGSGPAPLTTPVVSVGAGSSDTTASLSSTAVTGGTSPYSYQVQSAPVSGGTPGSYTNLGSATTNAPSNVSVSGTAGSTVSYRVVVKDSESTPASITSAAVSHSYPGALAAGSVTVSVSGSVATVVVGAPVGGTSPYTSQVQGATVTGSTVGSYSAVGSTSTSFPYTVTDTNNGNSSIVRDYEVTWTDAYGVTVSSPVTTETLPASPHFSLATIAAVGLVQGGTATVPIAGMFPSGYSLNNLLALEGLPGGVTASLSATTLTPSLTSSIITLTATGTAGLGTVPITITATDTNSYQATATFTLIVASVASASAIGQFSPVTFTLPATTSQSSGSSGAGESLLTSVYPTPSASSPLNVPNYTITQAEQLNNGGNTVIVFKDTAHNSLPLPALLPGTELLLINEGFSPIISAGSGVTLEWNAAGNPSGANSISGSMRVLYRTDPVNGLTADLLDVGAVNLLATAFQNLSTAQMGQSSYWKAHPLACKVLAMVFGTSGAIPTWAAGTSHNLPYPAPSALQLIQPGQVVPLIHGYVHSSDSLAAYPATGNYLVPEFSSLPGNNEAEVMPNGDALYGYPQFNNGASGKAALWTAGSDSNGTFILGTSRAATSAELTAFNSSPVTDNCTGVGPGFTTAPWHIAQNGIEECLSCSGGSAPFCKAFWDDSLSGWSGGTEMDSEETKNAYIYFIDTTTHQHDSGFGMSVSLPGGKSYSEPFLQTTVRTETFIYFHVDGQETRRCVHFPRDQGYPVFIYFTVALGTRAGASNFYSNGGTPDYTNNAPWIKIYYMNLWSFVNGGQNGAVTYANSGDPGANQVFLTGSPLSAKITTPDNGFASGGNNAGGYAGDGTVASVTLPRGVQSPWPVTYDFFFTPQTVPTNTANILYVDAHITGFALGTTDSSGQLFISYPIAYSFGTVATGYNLTGKTGQPQRCIIYIDVTGLVSINIGPAGGACLPYTGIQMNESYNLRSPMSMGDGTNFRISRVNVFSGPLPGYTPGASYTPPSTDWPLNTPGLAYQNTLQTPDSTALISSPGPFDLPGAPQNFSIVAGASGSGQLTINASPNKYGAPALITKTSLFDYGSYQRLNNPSQIFPPNTSVTLTFNSGQYVGFTTCCSSAGGDGPSVQAYVHAP